MLYNRTTSNNSLFTKEEVLRAGMSAELPFLSCGVAPEPQHPWDSEQGKYDLTKVSGYGFWVCQDVEDLDGKVYRQNPVLVVVPNDEEKLTFGDQVTFDELVGYYSRKKHIFRFQAKKLKKLSRRRDLWIRVLFHFMKQVAAFIGYDTMVGYFKGTPLSCHRRLWEVTFLTQSQQRKYLRRWKRSLAKYVKILKRLTTT